MLYTAHLVRGVGRAGGAERRGAEVPSGPGGGPGWLEGDRGRRPPGRVPPERAQLDRPLRGRRARGARRSVPSPERLSPPDPRRDGGPDLRAPTGASGLGTPPDRASARPPRGGAGALSLGDLSVPATPRADRAPPPPQASRGVPALGAGATDAAVADGRDGWGRARGRLGAQGRHGPRRPQPILRGRRPRGEGHLEGGVRGARGIALP